MFFDQIPEPIDLFSFEPSAALQADRIEPEFSFAIVAFDVDMGRLVPIARVEEKAERSYSEYGRHVPILHLPDFESNLCLAQNRPRRVPAGGADDAAARMGRRAAHEQTADRCTIT